MVLKDGVIFIKGADKLCNIINQYKVPYAQEYWVLY